MFGVFMKRWKPKRTSNADRNESPEAEGNISPEPPDRPPGKARQVHPEEKTQVLAYDSTYKKKPKSLPLEDNQMYSYNHLANTNVAMSPTYPLTPNICVEGGKIEFIKSPTGSARNSVALVSPPQTPLARRGSREKREARIYDEPTEKFDGDKELLERRIKQLEGQLEEEKSRTQRERMTVTKLQNKLIKMEKDTTNYMKYKMGFTQKIFLTDEAIPTKFHCLGDRKRRLSGAGTSGEIFPKRQRIDRVTECCSLKDDNIEIEIIEPEELPKTQDKETNTDPIISAEKSVQVRTKVKTQDKETTTDPIISKQKSVQVRTKLNVHYRSKPVQTKCLNKNISTSPLKATTTSRHTSPFKTVPYHLNRPRVVKTAKRNIILEDEQSDSDISCFENGHLSPYVPASSSMVTDSDSNVTDTNENIEQLQCLKNTVRLIEKKPMLYTGISKECHYIIQLLHEHTNIKIEHILLCLKKIRMNTTFSELEDNFGISLSYASKLFLENIPIMSSFLKPFIVKLDKKLIKKNLPIAFRHNYHNVSCIIDCLEIDIQKPSKAVHQVLTWSEYKKGNTAKYLISCTPNGLINFVSQGFGGRTSDVAIVENCSFLNELQEGTCILADRGFKHLEQTLHEKGMKLLRPPSVKAGEKLSKTEVRQTKIISSLRILIERVIRRVREFHMLKQHSVINTNIRRVLDHVIIIACALINLQDSLIK